jgi:hypothetical protein
MRVGEPRQVRNSAFCIVTKFCGVFFSFCWWIDVRPDGHDRVVLLSWHFREYPSNQRRSFLFFLTPGDAQCRSIADAICTGRRRSINFKSRHYYTPTTGSPPNGDYRVWWDWMKREKELDGWMFPTAINITPKRNVLNYITSIAALAYLYVLDIYYIVCLPE